MSGFPETPVELLTRVAQDATGIACEQDWRSFYELYAPAIRHFAELHGAAGEGEDVAQDVILKLVEGLRARRVTFRGETARFRTYVAVLIRNELADLWRRRMARGADRTVPLTATDASLIPANEPSPPEAMEAAWRLARHTAAVEHVLTKTALSPQSVAVYRAYALQGEDIREVAKRFGIPRNSVSQIKTRVDRMIKAVEREYMGGEA